MQEIPSPLKDLELKIKSDLSRAVIEGRTVVDFQSLVKLILQRKVDTLYKKLGKDGVIVSSELLTSLASAPQESRMNQTKLITVTFGSGILIGFLVACIALWGTMQASVTVTQTQVLIVIAVLAAVILLGWIIGRLQHGKQGGRLVDAMEQITGTFS